MSKYKVLLLDDEPEVLKSLQRVLRKRFDVRAFTRGEDALCALKQELFAVLLTDMRMPEMDGATFLEAAHKISPLSQKILLTGYSDPADTTKAINQGHIDFYLNKPWDNSELIEKLESSVQKFTQEYKQRLVQRQLLAQNQELKELQSALKQQILSKTHTQDSAKSLFKEKIISDFGNTVEVLSKCIQMHNLDPFAHGERIATQVQRLSQELGLSKSVTFQAVVSAKLYELGKLQSPQDELLQLDAAKSNTSLRDKDNYVAISAELLQTFSDFKGVAAITKHIFECIDGSGKPDGLSGEKVPIACQLIQVCAAYDKLVTGRVTGDIVEPSAALVQILEAKQEIISSKVLNAFRDMIEILPVDEELPTEYILTPDKLEAGMKLARDLPLDIAKSNYLNSGHVLTVNNVESLRTIAKNRDKPIIIYVIPLTE